MNTVNLIGNITKDLQLNAAGNTSFLSFGIAVQRNFKNKQTNEYESDFINCKAFGKTAEIIADHFQKGSKIGVTGRIQTGKYEKDGRTIYTTDVMVNDITFVERKGSSSQNAQNSAQGQVNRNTSNTAQKQNDNPFANSPGGVVYDDTDTLPF